MPTSPSQLETTLTRAWLKRGPLACALWPVSLLFGALGSVRRGLYRANILKSQRLPVPVSWSAISLSAAPARRR